MFASVGAAETPTPTAEQTSSPAPTTAPEPPASQVQPPSSGGGGSSPQSPTYYVPPPLGVVPVQPLPSQQPPAIEVLPQQAPPTEYMSMEEVGLLREETDPDNPRTDARGGPQRAGQDFRVLGNPSMPGPRSLRSFALDFSALNAPWARMVLAVALMGMVLIPVLALLARFVNGDPLLGCEIKALATKKCDAPPNRWGPPSYGRV